VTGDEQGWLAERFEADRPRLRALAYRMLGSASEADDALQATWLRLSRADAASIDNVSGWLTTVMGRVCLDALRSRASRREDPLEGSGAERTATSRRSDDPEEEALLGESVGMALLVVLDRLSPPERVAFILHDMFALPFEEIAPVVGRTPEATRQLASRARRRVRGAAAPDTELERRRELVDAFLAASREGDLARLVALLDPDVVVRADAAAVAMNAAARAARPSAPQLKAEIRGAREVAGTVMGGARALRPALVDGVPGAVFAQGGKPSVVFAFTFRGSRIVRIELVADRDTLALMDLQFARAPGQGAR
jgi:RNA polymerase sigma factor (sigma-70 family)